MKLRAIHDTIVCVNGEFGETVTQSGIVIKGNIGTGAGITSRWFQVRAVGSDVNWLTPGQWVLVDNGRWTEHFLFEDEKHWRIDPKGCSCVSDEKPVSLYENTDAVNAGKKVLA